MSENGFRIFIGGPQGIQAAEAPPGAEEACDLMAADGVPPQRAADMALAAHREGKDPAAFARHFVRLRKAMRERPA